MRLTKKYNVRCKILSIKIQQKSLYSKVLRRKSLSEDFSIPHGWTRISISDKSDPVLEFYVDTIFEER